MKSFVCVVCPIGCRLQVDVQNNTVSGNVCKRGEVYGLQEAVCPKRIVTTSVQVLGGNQPMLSVKTSQPIEKSKIFALLDLLRDFNVHAPVHVGQVLLADVLNSGVDIVATREVDKA